MSECNEASRDAEGTFPHSFTLLIKAIHNMSVILLDPLCFTDLKMRMNYWVAFAAIGSLLSKNPHKKIPAFLLD